MEQRDSSRARAKTAVSSGDQVCCRHQGRGADLGKRLRCRTDGRDAYVVNTTSSTVSVIDTANKGQRRARLVSCTGRADVMRWWIDPGHAQGDPRRLDSLHATQRRPPAAAGWRNPGGELLRLRLATGEFPLIKIVQTLADVDALRLVSPEVFSPHNTTRSAADIAALSSETLHALLDAANVAY